MDRYRYRYMDIYIQTVIQEFNLNVGSLVCSWEVWEGGAGGGDGCFKTPAYFTIYHHLAIYTYVYYFVIYFIL